jgi:hypothetical protein
MEDYSQELVSNLPYLTLYPNRGCKFTEGEERGEHSEEGVLVIFSSKFKSFLNSYFISKILKKLSLLAKKSEERFYYLKY